MPIKYWKYNSFSANIVDGLASNSMIVLSSSSASSLNMSKRLFFKIWGFDIPSLQIYKAWKFPGLVGLRTTRRELTSFSFTFVWIAIKCINRWRFALAVSINSYRSEYPSPSSIKRWITFISPSGLSLHHTLPFAILNLKQLCHFIMDYSHHLFLLF